jgi:(4S)-4-hydroxy-5-phosphonooxypentane-2,3-dione isomerase
MIVMTVEYFVIPGKIDQVISALQEMSEVIKSDEPGCVAYQVLRSTDVENRLLLVETYTNEKALAEHRETPHFKSILEEKVLPLLAHRQRHHYQPEIS